MIALGDEGGEGRRLLARGPAAGHGDLARAREHFESVGDSFLVLACDSGIARLMTGGSASGSILKA